MSSATVLFHDKSSLTIGQVYRYQIVYDPSKSPPTANPPSAFHVRVRNLSSNIYRPAYLNGPWTLAVSAFPDEFDPFGRQEVGDESLNYVPNVKTASSFWTRLWIGNRGAAVHKWVIEVSSQTLFSKITVPFSITIGLTYNTVHIHSASSSTNVQPETNAFRVVRLSTDDIWHSKKSPERTRRHLVLLTHGLKSNVTTDMLFIKDQIEKAATKKP